MLRFTSTLFGVVRRLPICGQCEREQHRHDEGEQGAGVAGGAPMRRDLLVATLLSTFA
jgi:hypothetical protein